MKWEKLVVRYKWEGDPFVKIEIDETGISPICDLS